MGSASSIQKRYHTEIYEHKDDYESKEEFKEDYMYPYEYEHVYSTKSIHIPNSKEDKENEVECNSPVWITINTIIKSVVVIRMDLQPKINDVLYETMKKVIMNIDSIYDIKNDTYEYGKIQHVSEAKLLTVKKRVRDYYGENSLVIIRVEASMSIADLGKFMYDIFQFQRVGDYLYVFV